jgi:hypothetical protein
MIEFLLASDSPDFCTSIIGQNSLFNDESDKSAIQLKGRQAKASMMYQAQINTVVKACNAAFDGDIKELQILR